MTISKDDEIDPDLLRLARTSVDVSPAHLDRPEGARAAYGPGDILRTHAQGSFRSLNHGIPTGSRIGPHRKCAQERASAVPAERRSLTLSGP